MVSGCIDYLQNFNLDSCLQIKIHISFGWTNIYVDAQLWNFFLFLLSQILQHFDFSPIKILFLCTRLNNIFIRDFTYHHNHWIICQPATFIVDSIHHHNRNHVTMCKLSWIPLISNHESCDNVSIMNTTHHHNLVPMCKHIEEKKDQLKRKADKKNNKMVFVEFV